MPRPNAGPDPVGSVRVGRDRVNGGGDGRPQLPFPKQRPRNRQWLRRRRSRRDHHPCRQNEAERHESTARWSSASENRKSESKPASNARSPIHRSLKNKLLLCVMGGASQGARREWDLRDTVRQIDSFSFQAELRTRTRPHGAAASGYRAFCPGPYGSPDSVLRTTPREEVLHA